MVRSGCNCNQSNAGSLQRLAANEAPLKSTQQNARDETSERAEIGPVDDGVSTLLRFNVSDDGVGVDASHRRNGCRHFLREPVLGRIRVVEMLQAGFVVVLVS